MKPTSPAGFAWLSWARWTFGRGGHRCVFIDRPQRLWSRGIEHQVGRGYSGGARLGPGPFGGLSDGIGASGGAVIPGIANGWARDEH